jgi:acyl-CoA reductase-like NAD-dependent aldehyde dehydrogenase
MVKGRGETRVHLPLLRHGVAYRSVDVATVRNHRTGSPVADISQANAGLIRRDLLSQAEAHRALSALSVRELLAISARAAGEFMRGDLPLDPVAGVRQSPQDYVEQVSATTGLPWTLVRRNMDKIHGVMAQMGDVIAGLTRGLDLGLLDAGIGASGGRALSFYPRGHSLGVVLPNNSPGVHSLWVPAIGLKTPLVLKPGSSEPWTPYRIAHAFIAAGCPPEAFCVYPADHAGAAEILRNTGRGMFFGDAASARRFASDPRVEVHGPGYSKVLIGPDMADGWRQSLETIVASIAENGGRSCVNASGVWVTRDADAVADALAERLARIVPRPAEDEAAVLAPFADAEVARRISDMIDADLAEPGAVDITARYRPGPRFVTTESGTYLLPTVVLCDRPDHPLANREFLFPFASVVPVGADDVPTALGKTLVLTALTDDATLRARIVASPLVDRLNFGEIPTTRIGWDQPHEGNLFEHLYARRAIQKAG